MRLSSAVFLPRFGKLALVAVACVVSMDALSPTPAHAQMPKIVVQCIAPLVPNADGTDCVRKTVTCREPSVQHNGRCMNPSRYVTFKGCKHRGGGGFRIATFPRRHADHMWTGAGGSRNAGGRDLKKGAFDAIYRAAKQKNGKRSCRSVRG